MSVDWAGLWAMSRRLGPDEPLTVGDILYWRSPLPGHIALYVGQGMVAEAGGSAVDGAHITALTLLVCTFLNTDVEVLRLDGDLGADVAGAALSWLGITYRVGGRSKARGADCAGLVLGAVNEVLRRRKLPAGSQV